MSDKYILDGQTPIKCDSLPKWAIWLQKANRFVALTQINEYRVSTIFMGIDHSHGAGGLPVLFETLVFKSAHSWDEIDGRRYHFWSEAEKGHAEIVAELEKRLEKEITAATQQTLADSHKYYTALTEEKP